MTIAVPLLGSLLVWLVGMASNRLMKFIAVAISLITGGLTIALLRAANGIAPDDVGYFWIPSAAVKIGFNLTGIGVWVAAVAGCVGSMAVLFSVKYMEPEEKHYPPTRYYFFTVLFIGSMIGLALTDNLIILYLFWEMIGFCSYILIAYFYDDPKAVYSGTKAFIVTRFGDVGFLAGIVVLWQATGSTNIFEIMQFAREGSIPALSLYMAGGGFILAAVAKSAQFPLHVWLPDAMEAPTTISALIHAACLVNAGVYLLALTYPVFESVIWWGPLVLWIGALTALLAGVLALLEFDIKRVLAYSTVSQLGFMVAAVGVGGLYASQFHLVNHAVFKALLFLCAGAIVHAVGTRDLRQMGGLFKKMPLTGTAAFIGTAALAGIPFFNGFFSKDLILESVMKPDWAGIPLMILIVAALFTAAYSLRMYWMAFCGPKPYEKEAHDGPWQMSLPLAVLALGALLLWLGADFYAERAAVGMEHHHLHTVGLADLWHHTLGSWNPLLIVTGLVIAIWVVSSIIWSRTGKVFSAEGAWVEVVTGTKMGFDAIYDTGVRMVGSFCQALRTLQTGDANYNSAAVAVGVLIMLILLAAR